MKETIKIDENKLPEKVQHEYRLKKLLIADILLA